MLTKELIERLGDKVVSCDFDAKNNLELFCYKKCSNEDDDALKSCRGVVFHDNKLVLSSLPYTHEYTSEELQRGVFVFREYSYYPSYEGTLLRLFFFNNRWYLSTHKKLDAFHSKWGSKYSFGDMFISALTYQHDNNKEFRDKLPEGDDILDRFYWSLDVKKQYLFLIMFDNYNRIVCMAPEKPTVYHVASIEDGQIKLDDKSLNLPKPERLQFESLDELYSYVDSIDITQYQGVIAFGQDNTQVKILNSEYARLYKLRGNQPSIKFRYLQVRNTLEEDEFRRLYSNHQPEFDKYERILRQVAIEIFESYQQRYIYKENVYRPPNEFYVMKKCHEWHVSDRQNNKIYLEKVIEILNEQNPSSLNKMIRTRLYPPPQLQ